MRDVSYDRPVTAKLYVHLDNGERFEATPEDLKKFGVAIPEPLPPAPFVRRVDELDDGELDAAILATQPFVVSPEVELSVSPEARAQALRIYDAIAARLRVYGPRREPEPAEMRVDPRRVVEDMTDREIDGLIHAASGVSAEVVCSRDGRNYARALCRSFAAHLLVIPPPEPAKAPDQSGPLPAQGTRERLASVALNFAAEIIDYGGPLSAYPSLAADVDAAAREHVAALLGPATRGVIAVPRGLPELSEADEKSAAAEFNRSVQAGSDWDTAFRAALGWYRLRLAGTPSTGGYDPAKLAPGSVVVAASQTYAKTQPSDGYKPWTCVTPDGMWRWRTDGEIPLDGVLVVDSATLGAWEVEPDD